MISALSLAVILGGTVPNQTPWNYPLQRSQPEPSAASWKLAGTDPKGYFITASEGGLRLGSNDDPSPNDVETAYRSVSAENFSGQRIRVSLDIHTVGVQGGAGLWVRVDDKNGKSMVLKDMEHNLIVGSKPWATYELVVDVPKDAAQIGYGIVMIGRGLMYFDHAKIEVVDNS